MQSEVLRMLNLKAQKPLQRGVSSATRGHFAIVLRFATNANANVKNRLATASRGF
ncbi:MAG: hypothetical protein UV64_C0003G0003 [Parcubacteria group bacterium GW2011_GWC1_43_11b]|nr:MAG: hypothetical protein UV50_C0003G0003 [Parcubacteria group bacterium GW2011_GWB1_42_9]KKS89605.1 MAG: hypothetical protein UV64_C0003G0003 [Parcubacteria group bacterium GW2011_GWC1_43_11b]KKT10056.1 MAG: hypothetical protein UV88_C0002G0003 [Parcubacteria group bacterium GW2011_GWA1_43_21]